MQHAALKMLAVVLALMLMSLQQPVSAGVVTIGGTFRVRRHHDVRRDLPGKVVAHLSLECSRVRGPTALLFVAPFASQAAITIKHTYVGALSPHPKLLRTSDRK